MLRPFLPSALAVFALASPAQQPPTLAVVLRDPSGQAVAGAAGQLLCDPLWDLPALRGVAGAGSQPVEATSSGRGVLRFDPPGAPRAGAVLVTNPDGLGALLPRLLPGEAQRLPMQPLAQITTATGTERFELWAAATPAGHRVQLPRLQGTSVRLPAGSYEVWAKSQDGWIWQRLDLISGQRTLLQFQGPVQRLQRAERARVHPAGWPTIDLLGDDADDCVLLGAALAAPLVALVPDTGRVTTGIVPGPPSREPVPWPPPAPALPLARLQLDADQATTAGAQMYSLRRTAGDGWLVLGACYAGADGAFVLPRPEAGDDWLLVVTAGHPPRALPWTEVREKVALQRGLPLVVTVTTARGEFACDMQLEYVPDGKEAAAVATRTDGRGRAFLPSLAAPGVLRVSDERFANQGRALDVIPQDGVQLVVDEGERLRGRALLPDGSAASGVVVTLRDARGLLRPAARATTTAADGTFTFQGLPADTDLVLFASMRRDARTWSARLARARAGREPVDITLQNEDPQLTPPTGRK